MKLRACHRNNIRSLHFKLKASSHICEFQKQSIYLLIQLTRLSGRKKNPNNDLIIFANNFSASYILFNVIRFIDVGQIYNPVDEEIAF